MFSNDGPGGSDQNRDDLRPPPGITTIGLADPLLFVFIISWICLAKVQVGVIWNYYWESCVG